MRQRSGVCVLLLAAGAIALAPAAAHADDPLAPVSEAVGPVATGVQEALAPVTEPVQQVLEPLTDDVGGATGVDVGSLDDDTPLTRGSTSTDSTSTGSTPTGSTSTSSASGPAPEPGSSEYEASMRADGGELGSVCLLLPGPSGAPADLDVVVLDQSIADQLRAEAPELAQLLGDCPAGTTDGPGVAVDVDAGDLGSVCLRIDPDGASGPLLATVVLLGHDLLAELTAAGLPVNELVAPCPSTSGDPGPDGTDDGAAVAGTRISTSGSAPQAVVLASHGPAGDRLPYTGLPLLALLGSAGGCLAGGTVLVRRMRVPGL